jgi:23S rRNA pseudouridine1911/1915/1917 synthase
VTIDDIKIIYEDDDVVVVNKPPGILSHPDGRGGGISVSEWFARTYPQSANVGEDEILASGEVIKRPGVVHRLDKDTSGTLLLAKTQPFYSFLKKQFQKKEIRKTYLAFVWGEMKKDEGLINVPIGHSKSDYRLRGVGRGIKGISHEAITRFRVEGRNNGFSFVRVLPETGRTHQIRVHFKAINHPIVCDLLYGKKDGCALGFDRLALHSFRIEFFGKGKKRIKVESPLPNDFIYALQFFNEREIKL